MKSLTSNKNLIVASNRLPYYQNGNREWLRASGGLINAIEPVILETGGTWIGWDGNYSEEVHRYQVNTLSPGTSHYPDAYKLHCVPLSEREVAQYYDHFSNETLWALFHYFFEKCAINHNAWEYYQSVNKKFAHYIAKIADHRSIVWVQDYHLLLVPEYLHALNPAIHVHLFLHIPFPHVDIYSILPWGKPILESLRYCESIGFHHSQYLSNFKGAQEYFFGSSVDNQCYANPISIDYQLFDSASRQQQSIEKKEKFRGLMENQKIILGVDRIDYSKGLRERLLAIESLLSKHPELRESFIYYQLTVPSRENVNSYQELKKEVDELVGRINGDYSTDAWQPIHYHYGTAHFAELVGYYLSADIALVTPLRDGMNLVCKEYVASHSDNDGVLILSQFAGASAELETALLINPYSIADIEDAILKALRMPKEERQKRMKRMRQQVSSHDISMWWEKCMQNF